MKQKMGRKAIKIIDERFGNCVVIAKANYVGNNLNYEAICDCGRKFTSSGQQFRSGLTLECPACRKQKTMEARVINRLKKININAKKYVLMNAAKTSIIRGSCGIHSYFDKTKARIAAKVMGAAVVPLSEANAIVSGL